MWKRDVFIEKAGMANKSEFVHAGPFKGNGRLCWERWEGHARAPGGRLLGQLTLAEVEGGVGGMGAGPVQIAWQKSFRIHGVAQRGNCAPTWGFFTPV